MSQLKIYAANAPLPQLKGFIRDLRPMWLLEEIGAPYEVEYLNPREDVNQPWFLAMNPFGKVPVLKDGDLTLFESGAICLYLADRFQKLIPPPGSWERALHDQWYFAALTNFEFNSTRLFAADVFWEPGAETDAKRKEALAFLDSWLPALNRHLGQSPFLAGADFALCDLMLTTILRYGTGKKYFDQYPAVTAWVARNLARPAFARADAKNGGRS